MQLAYITYHTNAFRYRTQQIRVVPAFISWSIATLYGTEDPRSLRDALKLFLPNKQWKACIALTKISGYPR